MRIHYDLKRRVPKADLKQLKVLVA